MRPHCKTPPKFYGEIHRITGCNINMTELDVLYYKLLLLLLRNYID